jgi:hypothetical protein
MLPLDPERPRVLRSRVHRLPRLLGAYQRLLTRTELAYHLAVQEDERALCRRAADALDEILTAGRALFPGQPTDPMRVTKRARKR